MPTVPMTPTRPVPVARTRERTPGPTTLTTGTGASARSSSRAAADAVLQATTTSLTSWVAVRNRVIWRAKPWTSPSARGP